MIHRPFSIALRTSLSYAIGAALWILLSDQALGLFVSSPQGITALQTYKGWAFVGVTSLLLYLFLRHQFYDLEHYSIERAHREETLRQSEYRFRRLFEQNNDAIFIIGLDQVFLMVNQRAAEMFGYGVDELVGMNVQQLVAPEARDQTHNVMKRLLAKEKIPVYERLFVKKDGTRLLAEVNVDMVHDLQGKPLHIQSILRDITQRKQADETVRRRAEELNALQATLLDVTSPQPLPTLLHLIVERAANLLRSSGGGLYLTEPEHRRVRCVVSYNTKRDFTGTLLDYGVGAAGHVAQSGEPLIIDDYASWSGRAKVYEEGQPFQSVMSAPLLWQGSVTGVIHILRENTFEKFTQEELDLLVLFANHAAVAVENARLYDALDAELSERVRAETASQQSQAQLAGIVTSAMDAIISIDAEQRIVLFNQAAETVFRCAAADAIQQSLEKFIPERFRASHAQHVRDFASSGITNRSIGKLGTVVGLRSDGVEFPIEASISQTRMASGDLYTVILRDITERVRAEESQRQTYQLLETVFDNTYLMFAYLDPQFNFVQVNRAYAKADERDPLFYAGKNHFDLFPNEENKAIFQRVVDTGEPYFSFAKPFEYVEHPERGVSHWDWSLTPIKDAGGKIIGLILSLLNVTERVRAETRLRRFWDLPLIGMAITSTDRVFLEVNQKFADMMGYPVSELSGIAWPDVTHPDDVAKNTRLFQETLAGKIEEYNLEKRFIRRDGTLLYAHIAARCVRRADGTVDYLALLIQDITQRKQHERERDLLDKVRATLARELDLSTVLRTVVETVAETFGYALVSLYLLRGETLVLQHQVGYTQVINEIPVTQGVTGRVVRTGQSVLIEDVHTEPEFLGAIEGLVSEVCVPLFDQNQVVGTLNVESTRGVTLSKADLNLMIALSEHIGLAVGRARLYTQVRQSEERFRNLVETTSDWIWEIDERGVYTYAGPRIRDMLGYEPEEIVGKTPTDFMPPEEAKRVTDVFRPILAARSPFSNLENKNRHKDGHLVALETSGIPILDKDGKFCGYRGIDRDVTERIRAEESERQHTQQINLLYEASRHLNHTLDLDKIYQTILEFISSIVSCDSLAISAFDPDTQLITCRAMWVDGIKQEVSALPPIPLEPPGQGTQSIAIRMAHSLLFNDYQARMTTIQSSYYVSQGGKVVDGIPPDADIPRSAMIVPLMLANQVVGVIQVFSYQLNAYTDNQLKILESLASHIASAQQNALLYEERVRAEQQTAASEAKMRAVFSAMRDVVLTIDQDGIYREIAPTNPGLLYRPPQELLGKSLADVFPPFQAEELLDATRQVLATQQVKNIEYDLTINGRQVWFSTAITPMSTDATVWVARDITERKLAETRIQLQIDRLSALRVVDQAISSSFDVRLTLSILLNQVMSQLHADAAAILLLNPQLQTLQYSAGRGFRTKAVERTHLHLGDSYAGHAVLERQTISAPPSATDHDPRFAALKAAEGFTTYFSVPLITKGNVLGVLEIFHRVSFEADSEWLSFLEMLAAQAAIAVDNANLFQNLQRSNIDLKLAYDTTLEGWSRALDLRDKETEGHSERVTTITLQLARAMELSEETIVHIRRGALLHDIGKMGVPDSILLKPGKLTDEEWDVMRRHPQLALDLLSPIVYLRPALDIPYCHHEKWDGSGYPRGLKGEEIPLAARIFAIADVWDALRSDRPYRAGWSAQKTRDHIKSLSGIHLDPKVVEVFLNQIQPQL